jgi:hypothetical protein
MADTKGGKGDKGAKPGKTDKPATKGGKPEAAPSAKEAKAKSRKEAGGEVASAGAVKAAPKDYVARLKKLYRDEIVPQLTKCRGSTRLCSTWASARRSTTPRR